MVPLRMWNVVYDFFFAIPDHRANKPEGKVIFLMYMPVFAFSGSDFDLELIYFA